MLLVSNERLYIACLSKIYYHYRSHGTLVIRRNKYRYNIVSAYYRSYWCSEVSLCINMIMKYICITYISAPYKWKLEIDIDGSNYITINVNPPVRMLFNGMNLVHCGHTVKTCYKYVEYDDKYVSAYSLLRGTHRMIC